MNDLLSTWEISNRINLYLLNAIDETSLSDIASSKGRTVGEQWAHIHNVRLMWLQAAALQLLADIQKIEKGAITKTILADSLNKSGTAIAQLIAQGLADGKIKGFKPHPTAFTGYLIAHEAHHRGQIVLSLKQSGHPVDKKTLFGMWEWGIR